VEAKFPPKIYGCEKSCEKAARPFRGGQKKRCEKSVQSKARIVCQ
jgi:hypothetical protein